MSVDQKNKFEALRDWFANHQGLHVGQAFLKEISPLSEFLYGDTLLQLGTCANNPWLDVLHYRYKWIASPYSAPTSNIVTSFNAMPLDRHSIDCIIAPLTLQAFTHQINPIDELDRILKPMGYILFLGINPLSLWNLFMHVGRHSCFGAASPNSMSFYFIKRAMQHRGYIQCSLSSFYFIPPVYSETWIHRLEFLNEVGKMMWPYPAGFYCLLMQKYEKAHTDFLPEILEDELLEREQLPVQTICPHDRSQS
ncbi:methyltransferase domain-containing protein [Legionella jordanis]|uniref:Methyl-transferase n=1 Tax=Legionella jordanis TaxID=456 RepID=A0A0W0VAS0_9GAMM|nr:methyltransferase domain-containing protein [Legionella jordanis]KTD17210.1 methyl-transferase [Legionella jordanis]RMX03330.1 methyltransferase [Legionella jordanis]RMX15809.1 methyltransferase [Legionella jordanis]VEH12592.1 methyl-transferase [Legionella jordanis]HAT8713334.1 methyltransferase [Legionella jordanis]